jgi:hypothetical protein
MKLPAQLQNIGQQIQTTFATAEIFMSLMKQQFVITHQYTVLQKKEILTDP